MSSFIETGTRAPAAKYLSKLANKRVLVLGGSSGIGFGVAEAAVEYGAIVTIASSNETRLAKAVSQIVDRYPERKEYITSHVCDLSDKDNLEANLDKLLSFASNVKPASIGNSNNMTPGIDHIAFTAVASIEPVPLSKVTIDRIDNVFAIMFVGGITLAKLSPKYLRQSPLSSLTFTGGTNSQKPLPDWSLIAGLGSAMEGLTRGLAVDLKPVRVNLVSPGAVPTPLWGNMAPDQMEKLKELQSKQSLTGTFGAVEDMAEAYLYLMKDKFVTGSLIESNGGRLLV